MKLIPITIWIDASAPIAPVLRETDKAVTRIAVAGNCAAPTRCVDHRGSVTYRITPRPRLALVR